MIHYTPHQERVVREKEELDIRLMALQTFIGNNPIFKTLLHQEQVLLMSQETTMDKLSGILASRIYLFEVDHIAQNIIRDIVDLEDKFIHEFNKRPTRLYLGKIQHAAFRNKAEHEFALKSIKQPKLIHSEEFRNMMILEVTKNDHLSVA